MENTPIVLTLLHLALKDFAIIITCMCLFVIYGSASQTLPGILGFLSGGIWDPM